MAGKFKLFSNNIYIYDTEKVTTVRFISGHPVQNTTKHIQNNN